jgi:hypothetical protein
MPARVGDDGDGDDVGGSAPSLASSEEWLTFVPLLSAFAAIVISAAPSTVVVPVPMASADPVRVALSGPPVMASPQVAAATSAVPASGIRRQNPSMTRSMYQPGAPGFFHQERHDLGLVYHQE